MRLLNQARHQRGVAGGQCPPIFVFASPINFLPPTVFFWEEKVAFFCRKKRWNLWFPSEKAFRFRRRPFFFFFFFGDHLVLAGKFTISARKSLRISVKTFFFGDHLLLAGKKRWNFGQKKPSEIGENLCPTDFNFAPPISRSWRRPCANCELL